MSFIIIGLLLIIAILEGIFLVIQIKRSAYDKEALFYYRSRVMKMVSNDSLISESREILCEAYGIEPYELDNAVANILSKKGELNGPRKDI